MQSLTGNCGAKELVGLLSWLERLNFWSSHNGLQMQGTVKAEHHRVEIGMLLWMFFQWTREDLLWECLRDGARTSTRWVEKLREHSQKEEKEWRNAGRTIREFTWRQSKLTSWYLGLFQFFLSKYWEELSFTFKFFKGLLIPLLFSLLSSKFLGT